MANEILQIFVSATTSDLGRCRKAVAQDMVTATILPVVQENFAPDYRKLRKFLRDKIALCDAVICLVGEVFGASPETHEGRRKRSYTQIEVDVAEELKKPVFVFLTSAEYVPDNVVTEDKDDRELQRVHRESLMANERKWQQFSTIDELRRLVLHGIRTLETVPTNRKIHYLHPPVKPSYFAGRALEISQLQEALSTQSPCLIAVIGMGGQGKTSLVDKAVSDLPSYPFADGFWCTAYRGGFTFDGFLDAALDRFLEGEYDKTQYSRVQARVERLLGIMQEHPILVVIDGIERWLKGWNLDDVDPDSAEVSDNREAYYEGLDEFLGGTTALSNGSHLLITSRCLPASIEFADRIHIPVLEEGGQELSLTGLDEDASADLLESMGVKGDREQLKSIAEQYGNHPLALSVLAGLLKKKYGGRLEKLEKVQALDPRQELHKLFEETRVSLANNQELERFLRAASHCFENPTPAILAPILYPDTKLDSAVDTIVDEAVLLSEWNLVHWDGTREVISLHPLVRSYFGSLASSGQSELIHAKLSGWYAAQDMCEFPQRLRDVKDRLLAVKHAARTKEPGKTASLLFNRMYDEQNLVDWLGEWGHHSTGIDLISEVMKIADEHLLAHLLIVKSEYYRQLAKASLGIELADKAVALFSKTELDPTQQRLSDLARAYGVRGNIHREAGKSSLAVSSYTAALSSLDQITDMFIPKEYIRNTSLMNRGNAFRDVGALSESLQDFNEVVESWQDLGEDNPEWAEPYLAITLANRSQTFFDKRDFESAERDVRSALSIYERRIDDSSLLIPHAYTQIVLGRTLRALGKSREAIETITLAVDALQTRADAGGKDAEAYLSLGLFQRAKAFNLESNFPAAIADARRSISMYANVMNNGGEHHGVLRGHAQLVLAEALYLTGEIDEGVQYLEKGFECLRGIISLLGEECDVKLIYLDLAIRAIEYLYKNESPKAKALLIECVNLVETAGNDRPISEALGLHLNVALKHLMAMVNLISDPETRSRVAVLAQNSTV